MMEARHEPARGTSTWTEPSGDYPRDYGVHALFQRWARRTPEAVAVKVAGSAEPDLSYRTLDERSNQLARFLCQRGIGPEMRVGLLMPRCPDFVVAVVGILKAGGVYLPLDPEQPAQRLQFLARDSCASLILSRDKAELPGLPTLAMAEIAAELEALPTVPLGDQTSGANLAYVMFTSGSTGQPKGVAVPHRAISRLVLNTNYLHLSHEDNIAQIANTSFDASTYELWGALLNGGCLTIVPPQALMVVKAFQKVIQEYGITSMFLTSALFDLFATRIAWGETRMRTLLAGGDALNPASVRGFLALGTQIHLINGYGPTENTTFSVCHVMKELSAATVMVPIGYPITNTRSRILDDNLNPVAEDEEGELLLGGDGLARGYQGRPALTAERFIPDPYSQNAGERLYRTGDRVAYRGRGPIRFLGRRDHQVKIRGFRIELGEIEWVLRQVLGVDNAIVLVREDRPGDKQLVAYGLARETGSLSNHQLNNLLGDRLPDYMIPAALLALDRFPLTPNGKVDRGALPLPGDLRGGPSGPDNAPSAVVAHSPATSPPRPNPGARSGQRRERRQRRIDRRRGDHQSGQEVGHGT